MKKTIHCASERDAISLKVRKRSNCSGKNEAVLEQEATVRVYRIACTLCGIPVIVH